MTKYTLRFAKTSNPELKEHHRALYCLDKTVSAEDAVSIVIVAIVTQLNKMLKDGRDIEVDQFTHCSECFRAPLFPDSCTFSLVLYENDELTNLVVRLKMERAEEMRAAKMLAAKGFCNGFLFLQTKDKYREYFDWFNEFVNIKDMNWNELHSFIL